MALLGDGKPNHGYESIASDTTRAERVRDGQRTLARDETVQATSHSTIFDSPMCPLRDDQKHRHRFTR